MATVIEATKAKKGQIPSNKWLDNKNRATNELLTAIATLSIRHTVRCGRTIQSNTQCRIGAIFTRYSIGMVALSIHAHNPIAGSAVYQRFDWKPFKSSRKFVRTICCFELVARMRMTTAVKFWRFDGEWEWFVGIFGNPHQHFDCFEWGRDNFVV